MPKASGQVTGPRRVAYRLRGLSLRQTFAALKYYNYRLWFTGQMASLIGTWMQSTAQGFLVFQLTQSPAYLGYVGFANGLPAWLFMLYAGVVADRISRRTLLVIAQVAMMLLAFILAALTFWGRVQPWHIVLLAFLLGIANAFDAPARHAFVLEMVNREDLTNAIALNSSMFNLATVIGPAAAGVTYALLGPAWCFTLNGISFIAVIVALQLMKLKPQAVRALKTSVLHDLKEGLGYVTSHPSIRTLIIVAGVISLFGASYSTLLPAWAVDILGGDATTNGLLASARGAGSLLGGLMIASLGRFRFKGKLMTLGTFVLPVLLLVFAAIRWLPLALLALVGIGWGFMVIFNLINALIQTQVTDELRGRVLSLYSLVFFGSMTLGALLIGVAAEWTSEPLTVVISAWITLGFAIFLWARVPKLRAME